MLLDGIHLPAEVESFLRGRPQCSMLCTINNCEESLNTYMRQMQLAENIVCTL